MKFHPLYRRPLRHGPDGPRRERARHHRDPIDPQAARELLAGLADPRQGPPHQGPAPARRASPLQRELHAARLDLAVLSAVRLARRRRADDEGPLGRSAVGRHDPARHRAAQEAARGPRASSRRRKRDPSAAGFSIPSCPTASRSPTRRARRVHDVPGRMCRPTMLASDPRYWELSPGAPGTASPR